MKKLLILISLISLSAIAGEVDHFTTKNQHLENSKDVINMQANDFFDKALIMANINFKGCKERHLYKQVRVFFKNHMDGKLTPFILRDKSVARHALKIEASVYKYWKVWDGYLMGKKSANESNVALSALIQVDDQRVGADKFEHMFGRGFKYFKKHYIKGKKLKKVFKSGIRGEKGVFGGNKIATGVFSYGDLAANFNGMRFWNHILQKRKDLIGQDIGPYVECSESGWIQVKQIDFSMYLDDSMDESINCSKFPTQKTARKFLRAVKESGDKAGEDYTCPMSQTRLSKMNTKYGKYAKWIINTSKKSKLSYFNEF